MKRISRKDSAREVLTIMNRRVQVPQYITKWGIREALSKADMVLYRKGQNEYWCGSCGKRTTIETGKRKPEKCPHCNASIEDWIDRRTTKRYVDYTLLQERTTYKDWQVIKEYAARKDCGSGRSAKVDVVLIYALFINPATGHCHTVTRGLAMCPYWCKLPFALSSSLRLRRSADFASAWYCGWKDKLYHRRSILPEFKMRGVEDEFYSSFHFEEGLWASARGGAILETLVKTGQKNLACNFITSPVYQSKIIRHWRPYLIARRHGLRLTADQSRDYFDYLDELRYLGRDLRNPKYNCPTDLRTAHVESSEMVHAKKERARQKAQDTARRNEEQALLNAQKKDEAAKKAYAKRMERFFGLLIVADGITIQPLKSVDEFYEEGHEMHHCVFTNKYYARPESLILSARDAEGQRLETIEVSLLDFRVVQSRAAYNKESPQHKQILDLMAANMSKIKQLNGRNRNRTVIN